MINDCSQLYVYARLLKVMNIEYYHRMLNITIKYFKNKFYNLRFLKLCVQKKYPSSGNFFSLFFSLAPKSVTYVHRA